MRIIAVLFILAFAGLVKGQSDIPIDTAGFKNFIVQEGEQSYLLKQYFFGIYTRGDTILTDESEKVIIQQQHLEHLGQLEKDRKLCIAGPFGDDGDWRGIVILSVKTEQEAKEIMENDPAVQRGTLKFILKPIWAGVGSTLF